MHAEDIQLALFEQVESNFNPSDPSASVSDLVALYKLLDGEDYWTQQKRKEVKSEKRSEIAFGRENNNKKNRSIRRFVYICG